MKQSGDNDPILVRSVTGGMMWKEYNLLVHKTRGMMWSVSSYKLLENNGTIFNRYLLDYLIEHMTQLPNAIGTQKMST